MASMTAAAPQARFPTSSSPPATNSALKNPLVVVPDFSSDVGRKKFGFSHEEIDESSAYYEGQFKLYQRCGEGTLHSPETGSKYVGQFQNDQFHGQGDQTWSDGSRYTGQWKNGQKSGVGEYMGSDRLSYVGQWEDGRRHGQGMQEYGNGDRYEGWWFHGLCSGLGTYYFTDGSRYEGAWANGRYDGPGMLYSSDGSRERQWHSSGLLMKREVLPPGLAPKTARRGVISGGSKVLLGQTRDDMHKPTVLPKPQPSKYLIRRETAGRDLSAPPLRPKTAATDVTRLGAASSGASTLGRAAQGMLDTEDLRPSTARGENVLVNSNFSTGLESTLESPFQSPAKWKGSENMRLAELQLSEGHYC